MHGKPIIATAVREGDGTTFKVISPLDGKMLSPAVSNASETLADEAVEEAATAFETFRATPAADRASFLECIAAHVMGLGDSLVQRAMLETGLPEGRIVGERARTCNQLKLFASLLREGSWVDARIETALPERSPLPRPDLRRMLVPIGPVVVFGSSNFPLAFSAAGGDSASALAAGCPIIVKAHRGHPGTAELVASAVVRAIEETGMPKGVFSLVHGPGAKIGMRLVRHPSVRAVGFTGSRSAGRGLFEAAAQREVPIPVFAEMSSLNPLFVLPAALQTRPESIAQGLCASVNMGVGQFCTKPGLVFAVGGSGWETFAKALERAFRAVAPATMLNQGICASFQESYDRVAAAPETVALATSDQEPKEAKTEAPASVYQTTASQFRQNPTLAEEVFGPFTLLVVADSLDELRQCALEMEGQLTATVHADEADFEALRELLPALQNLAGRLVFNGFPTGVEVCPSMHHGGPYPATTDSRFTSVGTAAILRWARPVAYQDYPSPLLPPELQPHNPLGILRLVNGEYSREAS